MRDAPPVRTKCGLVEARDTHRRWLPGFAFIFTGLLWPPRGLVRQPRGLKREIRRLAPHAHDTLFNAMALTESALSQPVGAQSRRGEVVGRVATGKQRYRIREFPERMGTESHS